MLRKMIGAIKDISIKKEPLETGKKKFAFVHIPKTAGMTMSAILEKKFPKDRICPVRLYQDLAVLSKEEINRYSLFRGHFPYDVLSCLLDEPFRCITILREPVARYYSYYKFMKKREDTHQSTFLADEIPLIRKMNFEDFASATNMVLVNDGLNQQCRYLGKETPEHFTLPYIAGKQAPTQSEIERAKTRLEGMEAFGLAERFQDSLFLISFAFGWEPIMDNLVLNTSGKPEFSDFSSKARTVVEAKNKADVELFDFAKILFETRYQNMLSTLVNQHGEKIGVQSTSTISNEDIFKLLQQNAKLKKAPAGM